MSATPNRPVGHVPKVPAWTTTSVPETTCFSIVGRRVAAGDDPVTFVESVRAVLTAGQDTPDHVERARVLDEPGQETTVFLAYWCEPLRSERWHARADVVSMLATPGVFEETAAIPRDWWETLHSTGELTPGVRNLLPASPTDVHEYWGASRDRIASSAHSSLDPIPAGGGPEGNVCLIRSGQVWSECGPEERELYLTSVEPTLRAGAAFLREHPESGCWSARYLREQTLDGEDLESTSFIGWFRSLADLERWASSHPSHLAIFGSFLELARRMQGDVRLRLWHEVSVLPAGVWAV
jgi:hypothetical protein